MTIKRARTTAAFAIAVLAGSVGLALAAPPSAQTGKAYDTSGFKHQVSITFVISATNPRLIQPGGAALGSQFAMSGGAIRCPKAPKNPGFKLTPLVLFGFPATTLKPSHGKLAFSVRQTVRNQFVAGSTAKPFTLKLAITGTLASSTLIAGTISAKGGPCATKHPVKYSAKLDPGTPVAPGQ